MVSGLLGCRRHVRKKSRKEFTGKLDSIGPGGSWTRMQALAGSREASEVWAAKTPTFRAEYVDWIEAAKSAATRARRIGATVEKVARGQRRSD